MKKFHGVVNVGVRDKDSNKLLAVYPETLNADQTDVIKLVKDWYYMQDCSTSEKIENVYVDHLTDNELKGL